MEPMSIEYLADVTDYAAYYRKNRPVVESVLDEAIAKAALLTKDGPDLAFGSLAVMMRSFNRDRLETLAAALLLRAATAKAEEAGR